GAWTRSRPPRERRPATSRGWPWTPTTGGSRARPAGPCDPARRQSDEASVMTVTCPSCHTSLTIPDERIPKGKVLTAACPRCKGQIVIDTSGSAPAAEAAGGAAAAVPAPRAEAPTAYAERAQARALVCVAAPAERDQVLEDLKREGYAAHAAADAADAIERLRFTPYALAILREGFGSATGDGNPVLEHLAEMGMATRRLMHVVLVSPEVRSHDASAAFARSVDLVLHTNDVPHLAEALQRSRVEAEQAYRVFLESLRAAGKG
ncbi:MAG: zinc-ribbon domain-containing protein, partial [candidate division NC10 bacterium]|nr:zinc-ribbon domain-containing protein [candidate division NC10 bacterium]